MTEERGMDRRTLLLQAGALGALGAFGGLGGALAGTAEAATSARPGAGKLVLATTLGPVNMDPADAQLTASMQVYQNIFQKLVNFDAHFNFIPGLATKWTQEDARTWTIDLVEDALFHNGQPVTARDVKFTFDRLPGHANAIFFQALKRTEAIGKHRVRFHLKQPYGPFLATLAALGDIVNEKAVKSSDPKLHPVGAGPYRLKEWVKDDHVTLERWEKFFQHGSPHVDEIVFRAIPNDTVRLTALQTGGVDWIEEVPKQQVSSLLRAHEIKATAARPYLPYMIWLNASKPPFDDIRVRQAVAWAVDRDELAKIVWFGTAPPATEAVSPPNPWYSGVDPYKGGPDPERAKALLKAAGREGLRVTFAGAQAPIYTRQGEVLKSQLSKVGIDVDIQNYEIGQWFQQIATKKYDMTISYWSITSDPAHFYLPLAFSSSPWNFPHHKSARVDAALRKFVFTTNQKKREAAYPALVRAVAEEAAIIVLNNQLVRYWERPDVFGPVPLPTLEVRAEDMWRKP